VLLQKHLAILAALRANPLLNIRCGATDYGKIPTGPRRATDFGNLFGN
jgi:hypothetical protein